MRIRAKLELTIWYDEAESTEEVRSVLEHLVQTAANRGQLSGEGPAIVDTYDSKIDVELVTMPSVGR
jgi:hypothetical protein